MNPLPTIHHWLSKETSTIQEDRVGAFVAVNYAAFVGSLLQVLAVFEFVVLGRFDLAIFSLLFSLPGFIIALIQARRGRSTVALLLLTALLTAHSAMISMKIGTGSAFHFYPLLLVALYPTLTWHSRTFRALMTAFPVAYTCAFYLNVVPLGAVTPLSHQATHALGTINLVLIACSLYGLATYFVWTHVSREFELTTELSIQKLTSQTAGAQLARFSALAAFSQKVAHATSEQDVLEFCGEVIHQIASASTVDLILVDSHSGPFGTFFERVKFDGPGGLLNIEAIHERDALRATLARDQKGVLMHSDEPDYPFWFDDWHEIGCRSGMVVPLIGRGQFLGIVAAGSPKGDHFDDNVQLILRQFGTVLSASISLSRALRDLEYSLDRADDILMKALPSSVAHRLKKGEDRIADQVECAGIFFCDLAGFTRFSSQLAPRQVIDTLEGVFGVLETECHNHGVEKIKTIGDCFMAVSGVSNPVADPAGAIAEFAMAARDALERCIHDSPEHTFSYRIGINTGSAFAGIIGSDRLFFDIWGDAVNVASRMEAYSENREITCNDALRDQLADRFEFEDRGVVEIKGKGKQHLYALIDRKYG